MSFLKLVLSFAPWIAFLIIAKDTVHRVEVGLVVALGLTVLMAALRLHRGVIMWVGLVFFTGATVAVLGFHNLWTIRYLGVLANGALAIGSWATLLAGKPFTLEYARQHTDSSKWHHPLFIRTNEVLTAAWASVFTFNTVVAWLLMKHVLLPEWACHTLSYTALVGAAAFTSWYPGYVRKRAGSSQGTRERRRDEMSASGRRVGLSRSSRGSPRDGRGVAIAGMIGAAALATLLLVPGLRLGVGHPWLGAVVILVPPGVLLAATGSRHYGVVRGIAVALVVAVLAGGVGWLVAVFTLVKALSGVGVGLAWAILLFLMPAVSVLGLGALALRVIPPPSRRGDAIKFRTVRHSTP